VKTFLSRLALILFAVSATAAAAAEERFELRSGAEVLEITALRPDILRIRQGSGALPEDASWAVPAALRSHHEPLKITRGPQGVEVDTGALTVQIDPKTLKTVIKDAEGRIVLSDSGGEEVERHGAQFRLRKLMPPGERYFGLGDKTGTLDRRDQTFTFWNTDNYGFGVASDPLYKSIPFVLGADQNGRSFGLFLDNSWRGFFDFGRTERDTFTLGAEGGPVDYYVMSGGDPKAVVEAYAYLTGKAPLTPLWALGFQQSHWSYMSASELRSIADRLRADKIPSDVVYLDIDYQQRNRPFTVNTRTFPDLGGLVKDLTHQGFHLVLITDLHIAKTDDPAYAPYRDGLARDYFLKRPNGATYVGDVWPGASVFPDFSRAEVRAWWGDLYKSFVGLGVHGFWNDMNEPALFNTPTKTAPLDILHRIEEPGFAARTTTHAEMHNLVGMLNSQATYEGQLRLDPNTRPFVLTRASYAGGQRYAATWTGDNSSSFEHLSLSIEQLLSLGLSGFAYAGDDIGGFAGPAPSPELLTRWIEVGAFNPIFRDHYEKAKPPQEVWVHGPDHEAIRRRYVEARYRLMPYIYAAAEENSRTGAPIMRPLFYAFPQVLAEQGAFNDSSSEFMLGDHLLVAPSRHFESPAAYRIILPGGGWYDYWTGEKVVSGDIRRAPPLDTLPVYVRPGAVIFKQPLVQSTMETPKGALELHLYLGGEGRGEFYDDDGVSFAYKGGDYLRQSVTLNANEATFGAREGRRKPWWSKVEIHIHGAAPTQAVRLDGRLLPVERGNESQELVVVTPDLTPGAHLTLSPGP
jgi:alpha-glucosidase